jgi:hypothetical protein
MNVELQWKGSSVEAAVLEISTDRQFKKTVSHALTSDDRSKTVPLPVGNYFWKISQEEGDSPVRSFRVIEARTLQPLWPTAELEISHWGANASPVFSWNTDREKFRTVSHRLQIARDQDFKNLVREDSVNADLGNLKVTGLTDGRYFWRLSSNFGPERVQSASIPFSVIAKNKVPIILTALEERASLEVRPEIRFSWIDDATAPLEYRWEIEKKSEGASTKVAESVSRANHAVWKDARPGKYEWRVTATLDGKVVAESVWRHLTIEEGVPLALKTPENRADIRYWDQPEPFTFAWSEEKSADQTYQLEVAADAEFTNLLKSEVTRTAKVKSETLALSPGTYFWRVRLLEKDGQAAKISKAFTLNYGIHPPLRAARLSAPADGRAFNPLIKEEAPTLSWIPVEGATSYEVTITRQDLRSPASAQTPFKKVITKDPEFDVTDLAQEGTYHWSVRPIDRINRLGAESAPRQFEFTYGARLNAPKTFAPEVQ